MNNKKSWLPYSEIERRICQIKQVWSKEERQQRRVVGAERSEVLTTFLAGLEELLEPKTCQLEPVKVS